MQQFIFNIVGCVMNAYNNITWESDRLEYEEGSSPYGNTLLSVVGIPSAPSKGEPPLSSRASPYSEGPIH